MTATNIEKVKGMHDELKMYPIVDFVRLRKDAMTKRDISIFKYTLTLLVVYQIDVN